MKDDQESQELSYEQAFGELESIVETLENEDLELEEALARFERGQALAARCSQLLESAELRLRELSPEEPGGPGSSDPRPEDS